MKLDCSEMFRSPTLWNKVFFDTSAGSVGNWGDFSRFPVVCGWSGEDFILFYQQIGLIEVLSIYPTPITQFGLDMAVCQSKMSILAFWQGHLDLVLWENHVTGMSRVAVTEDWCIWTDWNCPTEPNVLQALIKWLSKHRTHLPAYKWHFPHPLEPLSIMY